MPRREPFSRTDVTERKRWNEAVRLPGDDDLAELAHDAAVPADRQADFIALLKEHVRLYHRRRFRSQQEEPSRQAEAMHQVAEAARALKQRLDSLPQELRLRIEPETMGRAVAEITEDTIEDMVRHYIEDPIEDIDRRHISRPRGLGWSLPGFDQLLAELIGQAQAESARWEKRVSRAQSRRQGTRHRDTLARDLKALAMGCSPDPEEHEAEDWVARALDILSVRYPDPVARSGDFRRMFAAGRELPAEEG